jgi:Raf kinase inhibitor-like YbhB/YbcL family protein
VRRFVATIRWRSGRLGLLLALGLFSPSLEGADAALALTLTSSAYAPGAPIPSRYTCEGADLSPPLAWDGVPDGTKSFALIIDDPDAPDPKAPRRVWVHWVLYNIPPDAHGLAENADKTGLPSGTKRGVNDFKKAAYNGPCPPIGRHRYVHKLYALDTTLNLREGTKADLTAAMKNHVLAAAELIGTAEKGDR